MITEVKSLISSYAQNSTVSKNSTDENGSVDVTETVFHSTDKEQDANTQSLEVPHRHSSKDDCDLSIASIESHMSHYGAHALN